MAQHGDDRQARGRAARCPTCNIQTESVYKINGIPFKMPLSVEGKVDNGVCLACNQQDNAQKTLPTKNNYKRKQNPSSTVKPRFKSDADAIEWYKQQQAQKMAAPKDHTIETGQVKPTAAEIVDTKQFTDDSNHKAVEDTQVNGRNIASSRKIKVRTVTSVNKKQSPFVILNLDPCTPPSPASDKKPSSVASSSRFHSMVEAKHLIKEEASIKKREKESPTQKTKRLHQQRSVRASKKAKPQQIEEGTQMEFNRIMKKNNALSADMRQSILVAAVVSRKENKLLGSNESFLASNGKLYPDLRSNFGKYANMKQCAVCKQRVQGAYYCRLKHCHLEVPDYDGGNSAECLKNLFRKSVAELERIQRYYDGDYEENDNDSTEIKQAATNHGKSWSLDQLHEDLLFHVASYIPTLGGLSKFSKTCKRARRLLTIPALCERLLRGVYMNRYCERGGQGLYDINSRWMDRWTMIHSLKYSLKHALNLPAPSRDRLRRTMGVMSEDDEVDAIFYDNPIHGDPERDYCNGYFGMHILHLPPPPNANENWQPPILLHGDFHGVRIFDSLRRAVYIEDEDEEQSPQFVTLDGMDGGQVLSIIQRDDTYTAGSPCCFVGYASGRVSAITATLSQDNTKYNFIISAQSQSHECEVTSFTFAKIDGDTTLLFSACCGGAIRFYPNALKHGGSFNLESNLAFTNFYRCGVFSLTSTVINSSDNEPFPILCTGDRDGKIRLWLAGDNLDCTNNYRHLGQYNSSTQTGTGFHLVTKAKFTNNSTLVTGTNQGSIRIWRLEFNTNHNRTIGKGPLPKLNLRYDLMGQHSGSVEVCTNIGDTLLTSGGDDGKIIGWDINSGMKIGPALSCHPGRVLTRLDDGKEISVYSSVIDFVINMVDGKLITLCRDGILAEWSYCPSTGAG